MAVAITLLGAGCISASYVPQVREDYATAFVRRGVHVHVVRPRVRAISLRPPFACDARTLQLARAGFALGGVSPDEIERFSDFDSAYGEGLYAVRTVSGPQLDPGPWLYVESGSESEHPALSVLNVVNRYNSAAACLEADIEARRRGGRR